VYVLGLRILLVNHGAVSKKDRNSAMGHEWTNKEGALG